MEALEFYRFVNDDDVEFHWKTNDESGERDVIMFPSIYSIKELYKLLKPIDDGGIPCKMMDGYFAIWASDILDGHGIELAEIFGKDEDEDA